MSLNADQLDAFFEVAKLGSFSKAADELAVSQPALSQRIKKLEEHLKSAVFVRESGGVILTEMGQRLLLYCRNKRDLEEEFLRSPSSHQLNGIIRLAGFSSVLRSAIMPALSEIIKSNPHLQVELATRELHELPQLLKNAQVDFVITNKPISSGVIESHLLGVEENVLIESAKSKSQMNDHYFDNDVEDQTTFEFFKQQGRKHSQIVKRSFLDEIYAIIEAVENGWGRAVVPRHLIVNNKLVRVASQYSMVKTEVYLNYHAQPFYLPLHKKIVSELTKKVPKFLKGE